MIRAHEVRVIGNDGSQIGILSLREAQMKANETGLDLVEVAPTANPPVCRIMDFGKYKYQQRKKEHKAHHKETHIKEIQLRPLTSGHDLDVKVRHAREFLELQQKVKITLLFRGREMGLQERGYGMMEEIIQKLKDVGHEENALRKEGRNMMIVLAPKPGRKTKPEAVQGASKTLSVAQAVGKESPARISPEATLI